MGYDPLELQEELSRRCGRRVRLFLTDNRRRMVSAKSVSSGMIEVRLQRIFLNSDVEVLDEIGELLRGRKCGRRALRRFIDDQFESTPVAAAIRRRPSAEGQVFRHHDIQEYARRLNALYLKNRSTAEVRWGRKDTRRSRRSIRFACYDPERNVIIMNRKMDNEVIPDYFVEYVLFHEMLHEVLGIGHRADGRRDIHGRLFRLMEGTYPDYEKAQRFEKELCKNLGTLL